MLEDCFLDTSKIVNRVKRSEKCNWCLLPCCVLSLSEGCFMIRVYTSLANYILHLWAPLMYFSSHISGQRVFILLCGQNIQLSRLPITEGITKVFGKIHEAQYGQ
jgi:hypothetical protein